jgi:hypothetical protein
MTGGGAGVAIAGLSHCGNFQAKGTANRCKPAASAASPERGRSTLLEADVVPPLGAKLRRNSQVVSVSFSLTA